MTLLIGIADAFLLWALVWSLLALACGVTYLGGLTALHGLLWLRNGAFK